MTVLRHGAGRTKPRGNRTDALLCGAVLYRITAVVVARYGASDTLNKPVRLPCPNFSFMPDSFTLALIRDALRLTNVLICGAAEQRRSSAQTSQSLHTLFAL